MIDWREVDLGGATVDGLTNRCHYGRGILVWGQRDGRPYGALVNAAREVTETVPTWTGRLTGAFQDDYGDVCLTGGSPPRIHPYDVAAEWSSPDVDDPFVTGWSVEGDEDACNLAVSVTGRLYGYEYAIEGPAAGPWLAEGRTTEDVVVAGGETGLVVAGPLTPDRADGSSSQPPTTAWYYLLQMWTPLNVAEPPAAYTDAYTRFEPIVAGHLDGRPRVISHAGTVLPAPRVELDPSHPMVCVAHVDGDPYRSKQPGWDGRLAVVVQAVEGVQLWLQHDHGWTMVPGPEGRLQAARFGDDEKWAGWVVTDARLWLGDLSAVWDAIG